MTIQNVNQVGSLPPSKKSMQEERLHRKQQLAAAFRIFGKLGLAEGSAGHITARDPEYPDCFWLNPYGISFNQMNVSDLILCNSEGQIIEGKHSRLNLAAFAIHSSIHKLRPDVVAAAHAHSLYGKTWSTLSRLIDPITQDACAFFEDHALFKKYTGIVFSPSEGARIAKTLGANKAIILENHGLLTVGATVGAAAWWFISLERCCQVQLMAESTGRRIKKIKRAVALKTSHAIGTPRAGWANFQPLLQDIIAAYPELMD